MPEDDDDAGLMQRLAGGDDSALSPLMRRWKTPVIRFAYRYLGNTADAEEVAAETFVKVHRHRGRFRPSRGKFSTWLFAIAANEAKMRLRWRRRHPETLEEDPQAQSPEGGGGRTPSGEADLHELGVALQDAIGQLPHDLRATFLLYEVEGLSYRDAASSLGCSEKAIERRLARARDLLKEVLAASWGTRSEFV